MEVRILGPVTVAATKDIPAGMPRRLVAALASRAGQAVSADELANALWGGNPPPSARKTLQIYVHRVRKMLGDDKLILHGPGGYTLAVTLDYATFAELAERAGSTDSLKDAHRLYTQALQLWRGPAYADMTGFAYVAGHAQFLNEQRVAVFEQHTRVRLALGHHTELITELGAMTTAHPYREDLHGQLMLALYRSGRQADALESYRQIHKRLRRDLALEPGPALQELHMRILRNDPALNLQSLHYLPRDVPGFTGRTDELAALDELAGSHRDHAGAVLITAITGGGGVGKTALGVYWAHRAADRYPDGQLYINLRGYDAHGSMQPLEALGKLLRLLGTPPERIPLHVDEAAAAYRSALDGRRVLVLLDNASTVDQVRPLLPSSPGSLALVTSRNRLAGLVAQDGAKRLALDVLSPEEAVRLLATVLGDDRVASEPDGAPRLAAACGFLPLALRIAAADLTDQPDRSLAGYAARLSDGDRLDTLELEDDPRSAIRLVFDESYESLSPAEQRSFRLLGIASSLDYLSAAAASALLGTDEFLPRLCDAHLLGEPAPGRFVMHDLLKDYARSRTLATDDEQSRTDAATRLVDWYLGQADPACRLLDPHSLRVRPEPPVSGTVPSHEAARSWLDTERANILAVVELAASYQLAQAGLLVDAARAYLYVHAPLDLIAAAEAAMPAVERLGDTPLMTVLFIAKANGQSVMDQPRNVIASLNRAEQLTAGGAWPESRSVVHSLLAEAHMDGGDLQMAYRYGEMSYQDSVRLGQHRRQALGLHRMALVALIQGRLALSADHFEQALALLVATNDRSWATTLANLGDVYRLMGSQDLAAKRLTTALAWACERKVGRTEATVRTALSGVARALGNYPEAITEANLARSIAIKENHVKTRLQADLALAAALADSGALAQAVSLLQEAGTAAARLDLKHTDVDVRLCLAETLLRLNRTDHAEQKAQLGLQAADDNGFLLLAARAHTILAEIHLAREQFAEAADEARHAMEILPETAYQPGIVRAGRVLVAAARRTSLPDGDRGRGEGVGPGSLHGDRGTDL